MPREDLSHLLNAVREAGARLTAVQIESTAHAQDLIAQLRGVLGKRPSACIPLHCERGKHLQLLEDARQAIAGWPQDQGVLFLLDATPLDADDPATFWRDANLQREAWGDLACHVVFLLKPGNYLHLIHLADHLAAWIPLKLDARREPDVSSRMDANLPALDMGTSTRTGHEARQTLATLEERLGEVLAGEPPAEATLIRQFYLPMLEAALDAGDLVRTQALVARVDERQVPEPDRPRWWHMQCKAAYWRHNLMEASEAAQQLYDWGVSAPDPATQARASHALGMIASEGREFDRAEQWHRNGLQIEERLGDEQGASTTYHHLGLIAQKRRDFNQAEQWYAKSLELKKRLGDERGAAITYHQIGRIAQECRALGKAEECYRKSLQIFRRRGDDLSAAGTYHQLGRIEQQHNDFEAAQQWYRKSLEVKERLGDVRGTAATYHQLGVIAAARRDFDRAEHWYRKSLSIEESLGNEHGAAITRWALALVRGAQERHGEAVKLLASAASTLARMNDQHSSEAAQTVLGEVLPECPPAERAAVRASLEGHGLGHLILGDWEA